MRGRDPTGSVGRTPLKETLGAVRIQEAFLEEVSFLGTEGVTQPGGQMVGCVEERWGLGTMCLVTDLPNESEG